MASPQVLVTKVPSQFPSSHGAGEQGPDPGDGAHAASKHTSKCEKLTGQAGSAHGSARQLVLLHVPHTSSHRFGASQSRSLHVTVRLSWQLSPQHAACADTGSSVQSGSVQAVSKEQSPWQSKVDGYRVVFDRAGARSSNACSGS